LKDLFVRCLLLILVATCTAQVPRQATPRSQAMMESCVRIEDHAFHSAALDREMKYRILLPCFYQKGSGRFPVLYLLHGLYGDYLNWDTRTNLEHYAQRYKLIIVMPDADDSWYTNSAADAKDKFEDYIAKDLMVEIDNKFRTLRDRHSRAIAGLSMGGYGALKIALRYPGNFAFGGSLSGALNAPQDLGDKRPEFRDQLLKVFGPPGSAVRADNNVFSLLQSASLKNLPYFYLACGSADDFLLVNRDFAGQLAFRSVDYEYHETAGGHAWDYWDRSVQNLLEAVADVISDQRRGISK